MSDIEDIKEYKINLTQKQSIELLKNALNKFEIRGEQLYSLKIAIENILAEREQDKKRIKKLEEENRIYALNGSNIELEMHIKNNYIPKQKVKDLIENETINISGFECIAVEDLEELLEEK